MRQARVCYKDVLAGTLSEDDEGYTFQYDTEFLSNTESKPVSLTLPLQSAPFRSSILFPFFDGLIPEGWLLNIAVSSWKINRRDRFGYAL